jgi:membrane protein required for beta-lactamase induction
MALICILFGIIFERVSDTLENLRNFDWYDRYSQWLLSTLPLNAGEQPKTSLLLMLLPLLLATGILQFWFAGSLLGLIELLFGIVVFAYSLGPLDINRQVDRYLAARENGDEAGARHEASLIMQQEAPDDPDQQTLGVMRAVLYESNDRFFAVIFWFVLLGPLGALLYRLTSHTMRTTQQPMLAMAASHLQAILAWAPAHLVAIGYALTGDYEGAKQEYSSKARHDDLREANYLTMITAGQGALKVCSPDEETACVRSARGLVLRALVVWLAAVAILTLTGLIA